MLSDVLFLRYVFKKRNSSRKRKKYIAVLLLLRARYFLKSGVFLHSHALMNSVTDSPWYIIWRNGTDNDFLSITSLTRRSFGYLLTKFKDEYVFNWTTRRGGRPSRVRDYHCVLSILLHSYCSPAHDKTWSELFGVAPSTLSRTLQKAEIALEKALCKMREARIVWPTLVEQVVMADKVQAKEPLLCGRWGFVDGKNYPVQEPSNSDMQNAMFNGWLHAVLITNCLLFAVDGTIAWCKLNFYGSWNDGEMSRSLRALLRRPDINVDEYGVTSDTAFPVLGDMFTRIVTPMKDGDIEKLPLDIRYIARQISNSITSIRQAAEWGMGAVEKVYSILLLKLPYHQKRRARLLKVIHLLYNYRVRTTGISQIKNYFDSS